MWKLIFEIHVERNTAQIEQWYFQLKTVTNPVVDKTKPVVIAVLDTGIYEEHPDLANHILRDKSRNCVESKNENPVISFFCKLKNRNLSYQ